LEDYRDDAYRETLIIKGRITAGLADKVRTSNTAPRDRK
jgi:hypothetical protein